LCFDCCSFNVAKYSDDKQLATLNQAIAHSQKAKSQTNYYPPPSQ
jgi:hypothetical protein